MMAMIPAEIWARAGGGEGFGGGGGGGDGDLDIALIIELIYWLVVLCIDYPKIGIPLTLAVIAFFFYGAVFGKNKYQDNVITRGERAGARMSQDEAITLIRKTDELFNANTFLDRVQKAFLKMQSAWCAQDLESIRPYVTDGIAERFSLQFQEQRDAGYRNKMEQLQIDSIAICDAAKGPVFSSVTVCVRARAADFHVSLADGKYVSGKQGVEKFTEYWTFVRRTDAKSLAAGKSGLLEGSCPNCGAAIGVKKTGEKSAIGGSAKCDSCQSLLKSGSLDWVLSEITQATAAGADPTIAAENVAEYQTHDAGFSPELIEDRASVIFWRWAKAERYGNPAALRKVATPKFCDGFTAGLPVQIDATGKRGFMGRCAVGAVDLLGVLPGTEFDRAIVRVEWSGTRLAVKPNSRTTTAIPGGGLSVSILTLVRKCGVQSEPALGLSSSHCPNCGAAQRDDTAEKCDYCASILNDGQTHWVLSDFRNANSAEARALLAELPRKSAAAPAPAAAKEAEPALTPQSVTGMIGWLAQVISEDGVVTPAELALFQKTCAKHHLPTRQSEAILAAARAGSGGALPSPSNPKEARRWLEIVAAVISEHGRIASEDQKLLSLAAKKLGLSDWDASSVARKIHTESLRNARENLRAQKRNRARDKNVA